MSRIEYEWLGLRNAYLYEECYLPLDKQGLVLVRGLNLDDGGFLGAGKSTLFDAFARVQFGKGGKQDTVADIMNPKVGKNLEITLRLKVDDHPYEIRQYRAHERYGTALQVIDLRSGENVLPLEFRTHPQVWIRDQLLHVDETSFFNTAYLTQNHTHVLLHGKEAERRQRLTSMFGLDVYDQFADQIRQLEKVSEGDLVYLEQSSTRLAEVRQRLSELGDLDVLQRKHDRAVSRLEAAKAGLQASSQDLDELQEQLAGLKLRFNVEKELAEAWEKTSRLRLSFSAPEKVTTKVAKKHQRRLEKLSRRWVRLETRLDGAKSRAIIEEQLSSLDEDLELAGDLEQVEKDLRDVKTRLHHLNMVELPAAERRKELGQQLSRLGKVSGDATRLREEHTRLSEQILALEQQLQRDTTRLDNGVCSECLRPLDMSTEEVEKLRTKIKTNRAELKHIKTENYSKQTALELLVKYQELKTQLDAISTTRNVEEVDKEVNGLVKQERQLSRLAELARQRSTLEAKLDALPKLKAHETPQKLAEMAKLVDELKSLARASARIAELNRKMRKLPEGDRDGVEKEVQKRRADVRTCTGQIGRYSKKVASYEAKLKGARDLVQERGLLRKKVREGKHLRHRLACFTALRYAFGPKGIKQSRFRSILSDATENTIPVYSQILWPNKQISLELEDEDGIRFYLRRKGRKKTVRSNVISGGEKHKAGLAFLLGLRDLKEAYTNSSFNVLVVDEPFGNLDPQGEQAFLAILEMLKERFGSIFIISHRPEVLGSTVWDQTWWAVRQNDRSRLYLGDPPAKYLRLAESFSLTDGD